MLHSSATSSRRRPGARRRWPRRSPTSSGCSAARRVRRNAPRVAGSNVLSMTSLSPPRRGWTTTCRSVVERVLPRPGRGPFTGGMTQWTANEIPDPNGRTVVITGAGRGLGLLTAGALARAGARVVLGVRDLDKGRRAVAGLPGTFDVRPLDVADLGSVRTFADAWSGDLDVLINNAGVMDIPAARTAD